MFGEKKLNLLCRTREMKNLNDALTMKIDKKLQDIDTESLDFESLETQLVVFESILYFMPEGLINYARDCMRSLREKNK